MQGKCTFNRILGKKINLLQKTSKQKNCHIKSQQYTSVELPLSSTSRVKYGNNTDMSQKMCKVNLPVLLSLYICCSFKAKKSSLKFGGSKSFPNVNDERKLQGGKTEAVFRNKFLRYNIINMLVTSRHSQTSKVKSTF